MKRWQIPLLLSFFSCPLFAQSGKTKTALFKRASTEIALNQQQLESVFRLLRGDTIHLDFKDFVFIGVVSSRMEAPQMHSVVLKSTNLAGTVFSVAKRSREEGDHYSGRMINLVSEDGYEIASRNDRYFLKKIETARIVEDGK